MRLQGRSNQHLVGGERSEQGAMAEMSIGDCFKLAIKWIWFQAQKHY